ncbi:MAG: Wzz/FepE/Etk N-terminal domain-containing protein [Acidimicrobiales bacterium]
MSPHATDDAVFADYTGILRRRWTVVVGCIVVALFAAGIYYVASPRRYQSTAAVQVTPTGVPGQAGSTSGARSTTGTDVNPDTEAQIVTSGVVGSEAQRMLKTTATVPALISHVAVSVPPNSSVLDIAFSASTPTLAMQGADAFARAYLGQRGAAAQSVLNAEIAKVEGRVRTATSQLRSLTNDLSRRPSKLSPSVLSYDRVSEAQLEHQISGLNDQLAPLEAIVITPGTVISTGKLPSGPVSPRKSYVGIGGLLAGLLVGLIAASVIELRDDRIHQSRQLRRRTRLPVLAEVRLGSEAHSVSELLERNSGPGRAIAQLSHAVTPLAGVAAAATGAPGGDSGGAHSVLVLPIRESASALAVPAALSVALASSEGHATLLTTGSSLATAQKYLQAAKDVKVLPSPERIADTRRLLAELGTRRGEGSVIIVAGRPTVSHAEGIGVAPYVDTVILLVELNSTTTGEVEAALAELEVSGARVGGIVTIESLDLMARPPVRKLPLPFPRSTPAATSPAVKATPPAVKAPVPQTRTVSVRKASQASRSDR